jgi:Putative nuclear envelope organisation protein
VPQPYTRDRYLKYARENYQTAANKLSETAAYPGNWLWASWSDSDLKSWCDERGVPVPQNGKRDQLIATVRRNSRIASNNLAAWSSSLSSSAAAATQSIADAVFDTWSDSQIKKWADEKGIKVPQGSKRNEMIALVRKRNAQLNAEASRLSASAASAYGAATSSAGNEYAKATDDAALKFDNVQSAFYSYLDWAKAQLGLASATVSASGSSASYYASKSASSASKSATSAYSSASKAAEKSYSSAASKAKEEL